MKRFVTVFLTLVLSLTLVGCEKIIQTPTKIETPDREFETTDDMIMVVVSRKEDTNIHDFYVLKDNVEISFSKIECHNYYNWIERTEDVTDKYFEQTVFNKGDKGTFVCDAPLDADVLPKYVLDVRSKDDGSYGYWLSTLFQGDYSKDRALEGLDIYDYLICSEEESMYEEYDFRMFPIQKAVAISRYIFGDMWGLAETGGAAAGGDVESDGSLYWKAVSWGVFETGDAIFLDEKGNEVDRYEDASLVKSMVVDGDTLEDVRRAMFSIRNWPEDTDGIMTKLSKDRYEIVFDPIYIDYYAYDLNKYYEVENEVKYEFEVGLEATEETQERTFGSYVITNSRFDYDDECEDFYDFYKNKRFPYTIIDVELSNAVG